MRQMSQLSLEAYRVLKPDLTKREEWVLEAIERLGEASAETVADYYGVGINIISGRITGLKNKNIIVPSKRALNRYGRNVQFWKPANVVENDSILVERDCV